MRDEILQLNLFDPPIDRRAEEDNAVIDRALCFVENQSVLRKLLAGVPWSEAFGIGGSSVPVDWMGDAKGITVHWASENARLIRPGKILDRAKLYQPTKSTNTSAKAKDEKAISRFSPRNKANPF